MQGKGGDVHFADEDAKTAEIFQTGSLPSDSAIKFTSYHVT